MKIFARGSKISTPLTPFFRGRDSESISAEKRSYANHVKPKHKALSGFYDFFLLLRMFLGHENLKLSVFVKIFCIYDIIMVSPKSFLRG